tara:strand:+ start:9604 stop:10707 length:1104 start_codon:yes stop_codon:yes gene_type:complete
MRSSSFYFRVYIFFLITIVAMGSLNSFLLTFIWEGYDPDFNKLYTYLVYLIFFSIGVYLFKKIKQSLFIDKKKYTRTVILDLIFFPIIIFNLYSLVVRGGYGGAPVIIPFSTLFNSLIFVIPLLKYFLGKRNLLTKLQIIIALSIFIISGARFNAIFFLLIFFFIERKINLIRLILMLVIFFGALFFRNSNSLNDSFIVKITSSFGSEIRDGLSVDKYFYSNEIRELKKDYVKNMIISSIPGYSALGLMDGNKFRENLLSYRYTYKLGLNKSLGITGIRVGIVREVELFYGFIGVILLSLFNAFILSRLILSRDDNMFKFMFLLLSIIPFYSIFGQADLFLSISFNLIYALIICMIFISLTIKPYPK